MNLLSTLSPWEVMGVSRRQFLGHPVQIQKYQTKNEWSRKSFIQDKNYLLMYRWPIRIHVLGKHCYIQTQSVFQKLIFEIRAKWQVPWSIPMSLQCSAPTLTLWNLQHLQGRLLASTLPGIAFSLWKVPDEMLIAEKKHIRAKHKERFENSQRTLQKHVQSVGKRLAQSKLLPKPIDGLLWPENAEKLKSLLMH